MKYLGGVIALLLFGGAHAGELTPMEILQAQCSAEPTKESQSSCISQAILMKAVELSREKAQHDNSTSEKK